MINYRDEKGAPYSPVYLKTLHNQISAIFNHAVSHYNLRLNPTAKAGNMGKEKNSEMRFWIKDEYMKFADVMINRCHRYGQKFDVLVVNLVDPTNRSDRRIWTVLNKKLKQFDYTFGASDTLLGKLDADDPLRSKAEIEGDEVLFEEEHKEEIANETHRVEAELLSYFDEQVAARFRLHEETVREILPEMEDML